MTDYEQVPLHDPISQGRERQRAPEEAEQISCVAEGSLLSQNHVQPSWHSVKENALSVDSKSAVLINSFLNLEQNEPY
jgi:hypothetical protein